MTAPRPSCFYCESVGGEYYKRIPENDNKRFYVGHLDGKGYYACEDCKCHLINPVQFNNG